MNAVIWATVIGFLFGTVNGTIPAKGFTNFVIGLLLILAAQALAVMILVN